MAPCQDQTANVDLRERAGFCRGSNTCRLLRSLLKDEIVFDEARRQSFLGWATGRRVLPLNGLVATEKGKIKLRCLWPEQEDRWGKDLESRWPLPKSSTCNAEITLPPYSEPEVLKKKLVDEALQMTGDCFTVE